MLSVRQVQATLRSCLSVFLTKLQSRFTMLSVRQVQAALAVLMCFTLNPCERKYLVFKITVHNAFCQASPSYSSYSRGILLVPVRAQSVHRH